MNEKISEEKWKQDRNFTKRKLETMRLDIETCKEIGVMLQAEANYCGAIMYQIDSLLDYWDERSTASKIRFVKGAKNEGS